jgi:hypothetical protein
MSQPHSTVVSRQQPSHWMQESPCRAYRCIVSIRCNFCLLRFLAFVNALNGVRSFLSLPPNVSFRVNCRVPWKRFVQTNCNKGTKRLLEQDVNTKQVRTFDKRGNVDHYYTDRVSHCHTTGETGQRFILARMTNRHAIAHSGEQK